MKRIMLDIESLGTDPHAHVLSIGWAVFDNASILSSGHINLTEQGQEGRTKDLDTITWWTFQSEAARASAFSVPYALPASEALIVLDWVVHSISDDPNGKLEVWAKSPSFDCVILRDLYRQVRGRDNAPWGFWVERDVRTLPDTELKMVLESAPGQALVKHTAEGDAISQALLVLAAERQQRNETAAMTSQAKAHKPRASAKSAKSKRK